MFHNYIKSAYRNFRRQKSSFFINVIGLSIGIACSILIFLWVNDELQFDRFHRDIDLIYHVMENQDYSGTVFTTNSTPGILAPALLEEFPEFTHVATYTWNIESLFTRDNNSFRESGIYARPDLFHILSINLIQGNRDNLISEPNRVAISRELAIKYFGSEDVLGETITLNDSKVHTVSGVFEKLPANSSMQFDYVLPFDDWLEENNWALQWGNNGPRSIAKVHPATDVAALNEKIRDFIKQKNEESIVSLFLYPYGDQYLYGQFDNGIPAGGRIDYVYLFTGVAIFILLIACINFMNLSTARAVKRAREVGIRKSIGASRNSLIGQFIGESMFITFFAIMVSMLLVEASLPVFNDLTGKEISTDYFDPVFILMIAVTGLLTGLVAGSYPAFYLSSFEAVKTLKGMLKLSGGEVFARKGLVVFQFTLSVILIVSTIVVYKQIEFTKTKNLGYQKENLITFPVEGEVQKSWDAFRSRLLDVPGVENASRAGATFWGRNSNTSDVSWPGKDPEAVILFENVSAGYNLIETMGFELVQGRTHSKSFGADSSRILINEAAARVMGMKEPVGKFITFWDNEMEIIGLIKDFHFQSFRNAVEPLVVRLAPEQTFRAFVMVNTNDIATTLSEMETVYKSFNTTYPFEYEFMDDQYASLYRSEERIGALAWYFSLFAIIISCLGLFGLSAFTAEQRSKEIGVRKVLGASVQNLVLLLTRDFTMLVLISIALALPLSWWMMNQWLENYAYNAGLDWWIFAFAGLLAVLIAWLTVSGQSIKAALMNPVKSLKSE